MMLWPILHRLFGWDYIAWNNGVDQGIARVHRDGTGAAYYWRYRSIRVIDVIKTVDQVLWLTCRPSKYDVFDRGPLR